MAPSEIMRRIKGRTSSKLLEEFSHLEKEVLGKVFLGKRVLLCHGRPDDGRNDSEVF
jgi:REP element-mobilizing transposase RayT